MNSSRQVSQPQECSPLYARDAPDSSPLSPDPGLGIGVVVTSTRLESLGPTEHAQWPGQWLGPAHPEYKEDLTRDGASVTLPTP